MAVFTLWHDKNVCPTITIFTFPYDLLLNISQKVLQNTILLFFYELSFSNGVMQPKLGPFLLEIPQFFIGVHW